MKRLIVPNVRYKEYDYNLKVVILLFFNVSLLIDNFEYNKFITACQSHSIHKAFQLIQQEQD
jgi:hypothetical protein